ncbi:cell division regulator GpsB [Streptococcus panodentis]|uniref:Cell cycle protein GpsB n=1 Tax=Streptococcus panodentis TaxID=1581472 RepID=A0ABS5AX51_9STRE|nr:MULTISPECIES: cell division regulator GpsB [Streptococcus]KXT86122.1 Cell division protein GpsB [Streptococcus sp. DD11]MBP2620831.1 cell division regulator GpsB [Streptococcus panodentis]
MASIIFTAKDIFDQDFKREVRGYSKSEVDEFLDDVIKDYETYSALVKELREENRRLKEELAKKPVEKAPVQQPSQPSQPSQPAVDIPQMTSATNFDILKRLNRLEKEVFGKQILDREF